MIGAVPTSSRILEVDVTSAALCRAFAVRHSGSVADAGGCTVAIRDLVRPVRADDICAPDVSRTLATIAEALGHLADYTAV